MQRISKMILKLTTLSSTCFINGQRFKIFNMTFFEKIGATFLDMVDTIAIALVVFLLVYMVFLQPHQVNGQSMVPNFQNEQYLLTDKISYDFREPERGEVVVFHAPVQANCVEGTGCDFIKRIVGLPGETVEVKSNAIWINGQQLEENYIPKEYDILPGAATINKAVVLGPNEYFVAGDNRPYSSDSRVWGAVKKDEIIGLVFFRYWPPQDAGMIGKAEYQF